MTVNDKSKETLSLSKLFTNVRKRSKKLAGKSTKIVKKLVWHLAKRAETKSADLSLIHKTTLSAISEVRTFCRTSSEI